MTGNQNTIQRRSVLNSIGLWSSSGIFVLAGSPGTGKTEIARQVVQNFDAGYAHWCDAQDDATLNPLRFIGNLSVALAARYPAYADRLIEQAGPAISINASVTVNTMESGARANAVVIENLQIGDLQARAAFDQLIRWPLEGLERDNEPFLVVVDAIDESLGFHPTAHLVDLLAHVRSTPGLRFLVTCRSGETRVSDRLGAASLNLDYHEDNDLLEYAKLRLAGLTEPDRSLLAARVAAAGNFLYVHHVLNDIDNVLAGRRITTLELPSGLTDIYRQFLNRTLVPDRRDQDWIERYRPVLGIVAVGRGRDGLPVSLIAAAVGIPISTTMDVLLACGQFIRLTGNSPDGMCARLYHRSFQGFLLTDDTYTIYPEEAHAAIGRALDPAHWRAWGVQQREYGLAHLPQHLSKSGHASALIMLARDKNFLQAQRMSVPDDPNIDVTTMRLALGTACSSCDPVAIADLMISLSTRLSVTELTPLQILRRYGLAAARSAARELDSDLRIANELLLCFSLLESNQEGAAREVAYDLLDSKPGQLSYRVEGCATVTLARLFLLDPGLARKLTIRLLGTWGTENLIRHLLDLREYASAVQIAYTIPDWTVLYHVLFGIGEHMLNEMEFDRAAAHFRDIGESVESDNAPWPAETWWWLFDHVVWAVGLSLAMKGDLLGGQEVLGRHYSWESAEKAARVVELHAAAGYASYRAGDTEAAMRAFADAESLAARYGENHAKAIVWTFIGKTYLWSGLRDKARRAIEVAARCIPPLGQMQDLPFYDSPIHDDPFHGSCLQGSYLDLACLAARADDISTAMALAETLAEYGSRDAVDAYSHIAGATQATSHDREEARERSARVIENLDPPLRALTLAHLSWSPPAVDREGVLLDVKAAALPTMIDAILDQQRTSAGMSGIPAEQAEAENTQAYQMDHESDELDILDYPTRVELDAILDKEPEEAGDLDGSVFTYNERAQQSYRTAKGWAAVGYHLRAMRHFHHSVRWRSQAQESWEVFQLMAGLRPTIDSLANTRNSRYASLASQLCSLALLAAKAEDSKGISAFLDEAVNVVRHISFEKTRSSCATRVAVTAIRCYNLAFLAIVLPMISIDIQQSFCHIWRAYCGANSGQESTDLPKEVWPLLIGISSSRTAAVTACKGLAELFPSRGETISDLIRS